MQNLYPSSTAADDAEHGLSNGLHRAYAHAAKAVSTSSSSSSPSRQGAGASGGNQVASTPLALLVSHLCLCALNVVQGGASVRGLSQEEDNLSDSGHNSMSSLPPYRPPYRPHVAYIRSDVHVICKYNKRMLKLLFSRTSVLPWAISTPSAPWSAPPRAQRPQGQGAQP